MTLTDYDRLAEYVPNLTQSKLRPSNDGRIRLWQEGAQKIVGFDFRASVEMFMDEHFGEPQSVSVSQPGVSPLLKSSPRADCHNQATHVVWLGCKLCHPVRDGMPAFERSKVKLGTPADDSSGSSSLS